MYSAPTECFCMNFKLIPPKKTLPAYSGYTIAAIAQTVTENALFLNLFNNDMCISATPIFVI